MSDLCRQVEDSLLFYLDGEETALSAETIREHLESCPGCKRRSADILGLKQLLTELPRKEPPAWDEAERSLIPSLMKIPRKQPPVGFDLQVLAAIRKEKGQDLHFLNRRGWRMVQSLAAAMIIAFFSLMGYKNLVDESTYIKAPPVQLAASGSFYYHTLKPKPWKRTAPSGPSEVRSQEEAGNRNAEIMDQDVPQKGEKLK